MRNGKDGADGKDGEDGLNAPVIGVAQENGVYYWTITVDGEPEWLTDDAGNKLPVSGKDGAAGEDGIDGSDGEDGYTPLLKVSSDGYWMVGYDGGDNYDYVSDEYEDKVKAEGRNGSSGDSMFADVYTEGGKLVIVTTEGDTYELALAVWEEPVSTADGLKSLLESAESFDGTVSITLDADITLNEMIVVEKDMVLELNGKTLSFNVQSGFRASRTLPIWR